MSATTGEFASIDATVRALYDVISGPAGQPRDVARFRSLFLPGARLIIVRRSPQGTNEARFLAPDDYIEEVFPYLLENGFYEKQVAERTETHGAVAHVWSTYEAQWAAEDPKLLARGINSIQLLNDGQRWWVVSIYWQRQAPMNPTSTNP
jgi:hypothetical protein